MSVRENERHPVDRLAEEFVDRYRRGERPSISEYTQKYPELAADLQELLAALALMEEHARIHVQPDAAARAEPLAGFAPPAQLGDYRVLREIGRGGMGVVYEAVQESLGRHVALKVLPSHALLDSVRLKRFQHEAQAAARLHHTNIVPIFGVGEADGVSFYAMQFIQGRGLDEVIAELRHLKRASNQAAKELPEAVAEVKAANEQAARRTPAARTNLSTITDTPRFYRSVAALGAQIADALDHAHRQGVLHRDIKPSNLLLDTAGTIWITDFGLAKADGMEELTHSGDLVGTLRYMAPEHLQGKADARADIYSLASSLYELLALRPAFDAAERAALIRQIAHEEPLRLRRLDSRIPRDLETIVQKAMAHDPALRYATAGAMAADLRRFVDDKPIAARPVSGPERLWRWCLRRPALAGLCAALALSVVVGVVGVLWQWGRAERNLREAVHQKGIAVELLQVAQQSQRRAEQNSVEAARQQSIAERRASEADENYQTARQAVHELLTMASEDDLLTQPGLQPLRVQLLSRALQFYEERLADRDSDPTARRDLALAYLRLGIIKQQIGPTGNAAEDAYRRAIALLSPDEQRSGPGGRATRILLSKIENNLALELLRQNKLEAAHEALERAQQRLTAQLEANHDDFEAQAVQAMTLNNIGYHLSLLGTMTPAERNERAVRLHEEALALYREAAEHQPDELRARHSVANTLSNLGRRHQALHHFPQARQFMEECLAIREELVRAQPSSLEFQADTAAASNALGDVIMASDLTPQQRLQQALPHYLQALKLQERLVQENPPVLRFLQDLGNLPLNIADACMQAGENEQAQQWRQREIAIWDRCLALDNENADVQRLRAWALDKQGEVEQRLGNYAAALESWFSARQAWVALEKSPTTFATQRGKVIVNFKQLMVELGQQGRAAELVSVAAERQKLAGDSPDERLSLCYDLERACRAARRGSQMPAAHAGALAEHLRLAVQTFRDVAAAEPVKSDQYARARKSMTPYIPLIELDAELKRGQESVKRHN